MSIFMNKLKRMVKHDPFDELLPVIEYWDDEKLFILEGPAIGAMLIASPTIGGSQEIKNALNNMYKQGFPADSTIQFTLVSLPDLETQLHGFEQIRGGRIKGPDQAMVDVQSKTIADFFREGTKRPINDAGFQFRNFEVWVTIKFPIAQALPRKKEVKQFRELVNQCKSMLENFAPVEANENLYHRRMQVLTHMYDGDWQNRPGFMHEVDSGQPLRRTILDSDRRVEPKSNGVGFYDGAGNETQFIKTLSVSKWPDEFRYGEMLNLIGDWRNGYTGLFEHYMITLNVVIPDQAKARSRFNSKLAFVSNQAQGPMLQRLPRLRLQKRDFDSVRRELEEDGEKLVEYTVQITIFGKNEQKAEDFAKKMVSYYGNKNVELKANTFFSMPFFLASLPFGLSSAFQKSSARFELGTTKALPFITPHMASWRGNTNRPVFMLSSRLGQVVNLDPYESDTNMNIFMAATSGAGKSFFAGYLINALLGSGIKKQPIDTTEKIQFDDGAQVFVVDIGGSYKGLAALYSESQFLQFDTSFPYSLNPFASINDIDDQADMICSIIKLMASPSGVVNDFQNAEIVRLVTLLWAEKGKKSTITDFRDKCLDHDEIEIKRIGQQLVNFCEGGAYASFFSNEKPPVDYSGRFVVCELQELDNKKHLQVVVLMSIVMGIQDQMFMSGTSRRKLLLLDEAWRYLKDDSGGNNNMMRFFAEFIEAGYRTFRKFNAAGACITQAVADAWASSAGRAIINNSAWRILLRQDEEAIDRLENDKQYSGTPMDYRLMKSLKTVRPKPGVTDEAYSEVFVKYNGLTQVCRLYTDRKLQLILSTNPNEKARREELLNSGMDLHQAIDQMIAEGS